MNNKEASIITYGTSLASSLNRTALNLHTTYKALSFIDNFDWHHVTELHILNSGRRTSHFEKESGMYYSENKRIVLIIGANRGQIDTIINRCRNHLKCLDLRFSEFNELHVGHMSSLEKLCVSDSTGKRCITGLDQLTRLVTLDLSFSELQTVPTLCTLCPLKRLDLSGNQNLTNIDLSSLPQLEELDLSGTDIGPVLDLSCQSALKRLNLMDTRKLKKLLGLEALSELEYLDISCSAINQITDAVIGLKKLIRLDISNMNLDCMPEHLSQLELPFTSYSDGINLRKTTIPGVDMELFQVERGDDAIDEEEITRWFEDYRSKTPRPLREAKVVFLGNGNAGKSHTIERILNNGAILTEELDTTPGIKISHMNDNATGGSIHVNFWDFGGQDEFSPIYYPFLTRDALYVVVLNPASDPNEQAERWLNTIQFFTDDPQNPEKHVPVLIILNKTDLFPTAAIDESSLQRKFPGIIGFIKMSAMTHSPKQIRGELILKIQDQLATMLATRPALEPSCHAYRDTLQQIPASVISLTEFMKQGAERGLTEACLIELLQQLHNLGMIYYCSDHPVLKEYLILDPNWLTNALCIIAFNHEILHKRSKGLPQGLISHDDLRWILNPGNFKKHGIRHLLHNQTYNESEFQYILNLIRQFGLSVEQDPNIEFIPMLCQTNTPQIALDYESIAGVTKYRLTYTNLLDIVLHQFMLNRKQDIIPENTWRMGTQLVDPSTGASAIVKRDQLSIQLLVLEQSTSEGNTHYADELLNELTSISETLNMPVQDKFIIYKYMNLEKEFDLQELIGTLKSGIQYTYSGIHKCSFRITDILSANPDPTDIVVPDM